MFARFFNITPNTDKLIGRWLTIGAFIGMIVTGIIWMKNFINDDLDPLVATEKEVGEIISDAPLAQKDDLSHILNTMVDEQIGDAKEEIIYIEDKEDQGKATATESRKKLRLESDVLKYERKYLKEDDHQHEYQD